jgi:type I restriction-modification system DNA methylase subunit
MSQRNSEYERRDRELYETPPHVTEALIPHLPRPPGHKIWEPACASGKIVRVLADAGYHVYATDKVDGEDFFELNDSKGSHGIVTNPPYTDCDVFVQHALDLMLPRGGFVAILQRSDYMFAKTRRHLFAECPVFSKIICLHKRIVWFERDDGEREAPSTFHAWHIWDWRHDGTHATVTWA